MALDLLDIADDIWIEVASRLCLLDIVALCSTCKHLSTLLSVRAIWANLVHGSESPSYLSRVLRNYPLHGLDLSQIVQLARRCLEFRGSWTDKSKICPSVRGISMTQQPILWTHLLNGRWLLMSWADCALSCRDLLVSDRVVQSEGVGEWHADGTVESGRVVGYSSQGAIIALTLNHEIASETYVIRMSLPLSRASNKSIFSIICRLDGSASVLDSRGSLLLFGRSKALASPHVVDFRNPARRVDFPAGPTDIVYSGRFFDGGVVLHKDSVVEIYSVLDTTGSLYATKVRTVQLVNCVNNVRRSSSLRPCASPLLQSTTDTLLFTLNPYSAEARVIGHNFNMDEETDYMDQSCVDGLRGVMITQGQLHEWTISDAATKVLWIQNNYWDKTRLFGCNFVCSPELGKRKSNCFADACEIYTGWDIPSISSTTALQLDEGLGMATLATSAGSVFVLDFLQDRPMPSHNVI